MNNEDFLRFANEFSKNIASLSVHSRRAAGYLARQEIERLNDSLRANPKRLELFGYKVYSQNDEDGILEEIFTRIGLGAGVFCEIGVENGLECNTLYLLHKGWCGVWFEANTRQKNAIESKFEGVLRGGLLGLEIGYVTPNNINSKIYSGLRKIQSDPDRLDFLSIDVDGMDIHLFDSLVLQPKVLCIEYNAKFPPHINKCPVYDESNVWRGGDYMGASLMAITKIAEKKGYCLVATNYVGANAFFVRSDLMNDCFDRGLTLLDLYNPPRYYLCHDHFSTSVGHPADFGPYVDLVR